MLGNLDPGAAIADELVADLEGARLVELTQSIVQSISRSQFDRTIDIRMLASDHSVVRGELVGGGDPAAQADALTRLTALLNFSPYFVNAYIVDRTGSIPVCAHANAAACRENLSGAEAMAAGPHQDWFTDAAWANPWSQGCRVLIFVVPVRHEGDIVGVTYLEYDYPKRGVQCGNNRPRCHWEDDHEALSRNDAIAAVRDFARAGPKR